MTLQQPSSGPHSLGTGSGKTIRFLLLSHPWATLPAGTPTLRPSALPSTFSVPRKAPVLGELGHHKASLLAIVFGTPGLTLQLELACASRTFMNMHSQHFCDNAGLTQQTYVGPTGPEDCTGSNTAHPQRNSCLGVFR